MQKRFILIAEDDADDRFLLQTAFEENGLTDPLEFVENGIELMEYLDKVLQNKTLDMNYPGFILLDLNLPKKDGREVLKEIKQHPELRKIPVVVFTTAKNENEIKRCYEAGANSYVVKPVSFEALVNVIRELRNYWFNTASVPA
ncbi:response regulator [Pseudoflavitalea sp. G-6-1-2]|uniref:response regulator n=1 Tax=Pseudoflavitalea sp. G-6-1-2 TaxID=2728841 RepID=UPI00146F830D|nr:response regulator [Pseudoflavitalea sp. G-6-1-2]NML22489.1 response regulator [Pseudoflavitalea sp. G-6-1-2]